MNLDTLQEHAKDVRLRIHQPDATPHSIGDSGPLIEWHLRKPGILQSILRHPGRTLGSSYVRGEWDIDTRLLPQLIMTLLPATAGRRDAGYRSSLRHLLARLPRMPQRLPHWADISASVSRICLGDDRHHCCAWFNEPGLSLEQAQRIQRRRLLTRLRLSAGQQVLDLNAGWGSLALYLAEQVDIRVTAIVKTRVQLQFALNEARRRRLENRVQFRLCGTDRCHGRFDRVLADGAPGQYPQGTTSRALSRQLEALLSDDGVAWTQVTVRNRHAGLSNRWLQRNLHHRYGSPLLSELLQAVEARRLRTLLVEERSGHWAQTLETHGERYSRQRHRISQRFGESLTRHWEFMLASQQAAVQRGELSRYDLLIGNTHTVWPLRGVTGRALADRTPPGLNRTINSLTRDS